MNLQTFVKQSSLNLYQQGMVTCVYHGDILVDFDPDMFSGRYWQQKNAVLGTATGRGTTYFVEHQGQQLVLRHYYRGGLVGKLINDTYFYPSLMKTRAAQEFQLLEQLQRLQLPAPRPIGFRVVRHGLGYRADIITGLIANARDLVACLQQSSLDESQWFAIGETLYQFHQQGVFHHDLNCHNIMLDEQGKVWVIDFDQGKIKTPHGSWCQQNLDRLLRSFRKESGRLNSFHWQESDWLALLKGYTNSTP